MANELDLQRVQRDIIDLAMQVGNILLRHFEQPLVQATKSSGVDIVTQADQEAEAAIVNALLSAYPTHHIVGEEGGSQGAPIADAPYRWYVDPLDGTTNFASGLPHYAISIALTDARQQPLVGVIYDPNRDEIFSAVHGQGATLNGLTLHVSNTPELAQAVVVSGFPYDKASNPDNNLREWGAFMTRTRGIRRLGSAALDLCYVAAGRFDAYWERGLHPWDMMAGALLVREAGGTVSDYAGQADPEQRGEHQIIASNGHLHAALRAVLDEVRSS